MEQTLRILEGLSGVLNAPLTALLVYAVLRGFWCRPRQQNPCLAASGRIGEKVGRTAGLTQSACNDTLGVGRAGTPAGRSPVGDEGGEEALYRFLLTPEGDHVE